VNQTIINSYETDIQRLSFRIHAKKDDYNWLNIAGSATLAGTLDVDSRNGFSLASGDKFGIIQAMV
jgi:hypothetical protein